MRKLLRANEKEDLERCVDMYIERYNSATRPIYKRTFIHNVNELIKSNSFMYIYKESSEILGAILVSPRKFIFDPNVFFVQQICFVNKKGREGCRIVGVLHERMEEEARRRNIRYLESTCSHIDTTFTFSRLLKKYGWTQIGYRATKILE